MTFGNRNSGALIRAKSRAHQSPRNLCIFNLAAVCLAGWLDWITGYEMNFFAFYFIPVAVLAWRVGASAAYAAAILSGVIWFVVDQYSGFPYTSQFHAFWNAGMRLIAFLIIAFAFSRIRALLDKAQKSAQRLSGLLPMCAWCKKVRNDAGYWQQVEDYLEEHSDARFSHGVCAECAKKVQDELSVRKEPG